MNIPESILEYLNERITGRIALIGCRAQDPKNSFPCCEYDIACFDVTSQIDRVVQLDNSIIELHNFSSQRRDAISLHNMIPIPYQNMPFSSPLPAITNLATERLFMGEGKKMIVNSLFNIETADKYMNSKVDIASMHLKAAAYSLIEGILLTLGVRPMLTHELDQVRNITQPRDLIKHAIESALECLGLERASKTTIGRSYKALKEILRKSDDQNLIVSKIDYLLANGLLADCYYYIGRIGVSHLEASNFREVYPKLCKVTLDLNSDLGLPSKISSTLKESCKRVLKVKV